MLHVYVDADACPVKDEIYKVADRYGLPVTLVANSYMKIPGGGRVKLVVVDEGWTRPTTGSSRRWRRTTS